MLPSVNVRFCLLKRPVIALIPETIFRSVAMAGQYAISQCSSGDTLYGFTCALAFTVSNEV